MDEDMARIVATTGTVVSRQLTELYETLNQHLPDEMQLRLGIASVLAEVGLCIIEPAFKACPALRTEFERRLEKYGRAS